MQGLSNERDPLWQSLHDAMWQGSPTDRYQASCVFSDYLEEHGETHLAWMVRGGAAVRRRGGACGWRWQWGAFLDGIRYRFKMQVIFGLHQVTFRTPDGVFELFHFHYGNALWTDIRLQCRQPSQDWFLFEFEWFWHRLAQSKSLGRPNIPNETYAAITDPLMITRPRKRLDVSRLQFAGVQA